MEKYEIRIVEVDGICVLIYNGNIINPFSDKFAKRYLLKYIGCNARESILSEIKSYYDTQFKEHYLLKQVVAIKLDSEIPGVKEYR